MWRVSQNRMRFLPISLALGLFAGDVVTLAISGDLILGRVVVSALISVAIYYAGRWLLRRRQNSPGHG